MPARAAVVISLGLLIHSTGMLAQKPRAQKPAPAASAQPGTDSPTSVPDTDPAPPDQSDTPGCRLLFGG